MYRLFLNLFLTIAKKSRTSSPEVVFRKQNTNTRWLIGNNPDHLSAVQERERGAGENKTK